MEESVYEAAGNHADSDSDSSHSSDGSNSDSHNAPPVPRTAGDLDSEDSGNSEGSDNSDGSLSSSDSDDSSSHDEDQEGGAPSRRKRKLIISENIADPAVSEVLPQHTHGAPSEETGVATPIAVLAEQSEGSDADTEEEDDDDDVDYLAKFDVETRRQHLLEHHPQALCPNFEEVRSLSVVQRDSVGMPIDPLHKTVPILTKYERTRVLGVRATQLANGAPPYVKLVKPMLNELLIAEQELHDQKLPFIIRRPLPNGGSEYWKLKDLAILE
jgi:DNA-directed RNA polymerase I, II, and III subunit RPABC2